MAIPSMSLQRWLSHHLLRSLDEEDLMALTEAIVLEVASRRSRGQQPQCDEPASHTWAATLPKHHVSVLETLGQEDEDVPDEIRKLLTRPAEPQEE